MPSIFNKPRNPYVRTIAVGGVTMRGDTQTTLGIGASGILVNSQHVGGGGLEDSMFAQDSKDDVAFSSSHVNDETHSCNVNISTG